jgi:hypothetical protein
MKTCLKNLLSEAAVSEWKPRVGIVGKSALTCGEYSGFIPAINTQEEEVNIEAWIEDRPKTGAHALLILPFTSCQAPISHLEKSWQSERIILCMYEHAQMVGSVGAPRPGGKMRPASTFWDPTTNVPIYDLPAPNPLHRRSHALGFGQGHGSGSWFSLLHLFSLVPNPPPLLLLVSFLSSSARVWSLDCCSLLCMHTCRQGLLHAHLTP